MDNHRIRCLPERIPATAWMVGLVLLAGCTVVESAPTISPLPSPLAPPTIVHAGVVVDSEVAETARVEFEDGEVLELDAATYRQLTPHGWSGPLLVVGDDPATGGFVASFSTQDGLPSDCFVENSTGWNADAYILIRGILWRKASTFDEVPDINFGFPYADGSRFCFDRDAQVTGVLAP